MVAIRPVVPALLIAGEIVRPIDQLRYAEADGRAGPIVVVVVAATLTHPDAFRHNDLLGNVVLAHEHAVGAEILGTAGFGAGGTALADHHNLPVRGAAEVFLVLCRCLGEAKLVLAAGDQGAWRCGFEKIGPLLKPPNPQIATTSSTRASRMHPYSAVAGMVLRGAAPVLAGSSGGVQLGSTVPGRRRRRCAETQLGPFAPPQCRQSQCRIGRGYVGGLNSPLVQPQIGHPEPARRIFLQSEVR